MKKPFDFSKQAVMDLAGADAARALAEDVGTGDLTAGGGITECTRGNLALLLDGRWVTPSLHCGLLGGIGRANALRDGRLVEAVVRVDDLPRVEALAFASSLRGWIAADLLHSGLLCGGVGQSHVNGGKGLGLGDFEQAFF